MSIQPHIHVAQVAPRVVVCGEPNRANRIASLLNNAELVAENREYRLFSGEFAGQPITVCSTGIGAPSMIIAVEELARSGAKAIVRVGSAGAMQSEIGLGELILVEGAVRDEGGSKAYIGAAYPAYSSFELVLEMQRFLAEQSVPTHRGIVRSHDSFYTDEEAELCRYWHRKGILAADMETSALLTVGRLRGLDVASVLNNVVLYEQDVQTGVNQYVNADQRMMQGETLAARAALHALNALKFD
ncbi:nucleoside phosphorylase [Vibrio cholerae]|uniref:nucleoside phosphorylase n=1 Tax=Vibrio cholerae TaxID=666 RepID=UPI00021A9DDD|nr:nucleoside phosphorylase [Vibrio cholerae]EGQ9729718.1 nucleoside phosphorylase [Vibrio cholerae]EGR0657042.1 nucleoside phosphorylase [Vibrio cholerae]EGR0942048.1 nucleoside phosphorylase [Vibrio cholerae]EGR1418955.1 nucleoside phosphorylase [Vibrio cholerae]EGR2837987.1 nucleoside phosphorylase [Vibrio cholerae]